MYLVVDLSLVSMFYSFNVYASEYMFISLILVCNDAKCVYELAWDKY